MNKLVKLKYHAYGLQNALYGADDVLNLTQYTELLKQLGFLLDARQIREIDLSTAIQDDAVLSGLTADLTRIRAGNNI